MEGWSGQITQPLLTVVLGINRSGTSVATHLLNKAGFYPGEAREGIESNQWHRAGYFERWKIVRTNDRILGLGGGALDSPCAERDIMGVAMDEEIAGLLKRHEGHPLAVIRDPRRCLTVPVWQRVWGEMVRIIAVTRHPDAVATSLMKQDGFSRAKSLGLWETYNERIARCVDGYPCFVLPCEELLFLKRKTRSRQGSEFLHPSGSLEEFAAKVIHPCLHCHSGERAASQVPSEAGMKSRVPCRRAHDVLSQGKRAEAMPLSQGASSTQFWWDYPKFANGSTTVVLISHKHLLLTEIRNALSALGHRVRLLLLGSDELPRSEVAQQFIGVLKEVKPDFVLTINHQGFDHEGVVTGILTEHHIPFASWYVDSPHLIIRHYAHNRSPYLTLFLWDRDYLPIVKQLGFDKAAYLPLGVDETQFRPLKEKVNPLARLACTVSFVGNSMVIKTRAVLTRNRINGALLAQFPAVCRAFEKSDHLIVRDLLAEKFPDLARELASLTEPQALGYETGVTWRATGSYRGDLVKTLQPFDPLIVGDPGWKEVVGEDFRLHRELNYYSDLSYFYNVSTVSFNATSRQMKNGVNQRVFDVPACKSVLVTDWTSQLEALMEPGREVLAYRRAEEIPDLVDRALKDERLRHKIAAQGYHRVRAEHTYRHRIERLIAVMREHYG